VNGAAAAVDAAMVEVVAEAGDFFSVAAHAGFASKRALLISKTSGSYEIF
jgi:hypothetical protein